MMSRTATTSEVAVAATTKDSRAALFAISEIEEVQTRTGFSEPRMSLARRNGEEGMIPRETLAKSRRWHSS